MRQLVLRVKHYFISARTLRGSSSGIIKNPPKDTRALGKKATESAPATQSEFSKLPPTEPSRHLEIPEKQAPEGIKTVKKWQSPLVSDSKDVATKQSRYETRFILAEEINKELESVSNDFDKILELVQKHRSQLDNLNCYNALGYLHANLKSTSIQFDDKWLAISSKSILKDSRFLQLCDLLYKKSRSFPPNACVANVIRLLDLGVPMKTPIIYIYLNLLKNSINELTVTDALTLARCLAKFASLRLPTALNAGLRLLMQKRADEDFEGFAADLSEKNIFYNELNLMLLLQHFGDALTPIVRNHVLKNVAFDMIDSGSLFGSSLTKFVALLNKEWVSPDYFDKCFSALENQTGKLSVLDAVEVANLCSKFQRFNEQILLKNLCEIMNRNLLVNLEECKTFTFLLVRLNFAAPDLFKTVLEIVGISALLDELGPAEFLEACLNHLHANKEALKDIIERCDLESEWKDLETKTKLILYHLRHFYGLGVSLIPNEFPACFEQVEEMLAVVTNENSCDNLSEKLETLPYLLSVVKRNGIKVGDHDLVLRMYIPAVDGQAKKHFIVPVGAADFYQNRFDLVWTCRLRFFLLDRFLRGSDDAISVVPINLTRFRNLESDKERFAYVEDCLANKGDRDIMKILHPQ